MLESIKSVERHFNRWYNYPYVFLNDGDFNETFRATVQNYTSSRVEFGKIDPKMWGFPDWIDPKVAREGIAKQGDDAIMYGGMESYHAMCRFYSGYVICPLEEIYSDDGKILLQARASTEVRLVLASGARDQVFLRHHIVCYDPSLLSPWLTQTATRS